MHHPVSAMGTLHYQTFIAICTYCIAQLTLLDTSQTDHLTSSHSHKQKSKIAMLLIMYIEAVSTNHDYSSAYSINKIHYSN